MRASSWPSTTPVSCEACFAAAIDSGVTNSPAVVLASSDRAHRVDGLLERGHIGLETEVAFGRGWILPTDGEGLQASVEAISDDAFFRHEIEHVELVDLRRGD